MLAGGIIMIIVKKLLAPIFAGVLVAFLFIAAETIFIPKPVSNLEPLKAETVIEPIPPTKDEGSEEAIQNYQKPAQHSPKETRAIPGASQNSAKLPQKPNDSALVTQNSSLLTLNSEKLATGDRGLATNHKEPPKKLDKFLNQETDNMNVLFIGVDKGTLLACSIFTINYQDKYQAGGVFLPTYSRPPRYKYSFAQIYEKAGVEGLRQVLEKEMQIDIELYYSIEREFLRQLETYIDPIYVDNKKVEVYNLFTMAVSPQDEEILGALTRELLKPGVFFTKLPRILLDATKYITTDFKVTFQNLKFHYNNIVNLDTNNIKKIVLATHKKVSGNKTYHEIDAYHLHNSIYEITR